MRVWATTALTVPMVLGADAVTTGGVPGPRTVALVVGVVMLTVTLTSLAARHRGARGVVALAVAGQVAGHGALLAVRAGSGALRDGCLPAVGRGADAGLRLTVLRADPSCPPGTVAMAPALSAALGAVAVAALVLVAHALAAALTGLLLTLGELSLAAAAALSALLPVLRPLRPPALHRPPARAPLALPRGFSPRLSVPLGLGLRGPPLRAA